MIDVDVRPWVAADLDAVIVDEGNGPELRPAKRSPASWFATLRKLLGSQQKAVPVRIHIERDRKRSLAANSYLWVSYRIAFEQLQVLAKEAGKPCPFDDVYDLHEWWKCKHLGFEERVLPDGRSITKLRSSTTLTPGQFAEFVDAFVAEMAQLRVYIPPASHEERKEWAA